MKKYCDSCDHEVDYEVREIEATYPVKDEDVTIRANVCFCLGCGHDLWYEKLDDDGIQRAYDVFCKRYNLFMHKGYSAKVEFGEKSDRFHGVIREIEHPVCFSGATREDAEQAFRVAVDDYLAFCMQLGKQPE